MMDILYTEISLPILYQDIFCTKNTAEESTMSGALNFLDGYNYQDIAGMVVDRTINKSVHPPTLARRDGKTSYQLKKSTLRIYSPVARDIIEVGIVDLAAYLSRRRFSMEEAAAIIDPNDPNIVNPLENLASSYGIRFPNKKNDTHRPTLAQPVPPPLAQASRPPIESQPSGIKEVSAGLCTKQTGRSGPGKLIFCGRPVAPGSRFCEAHDL